MKPPEKSDSKRVASSSPRPCSGPSDSTIRRRLKELRSFIDAEDSDPLERRVAYEVEQAIRWARQNTVDWPTPLQSAKDTAHLIRQEFLGQNTQGQVRREATLPAPLGSPFVVHCKRAKHDVYIGRPSKWGNPFEIGKDGDRETVIRKYREWVVTQPQLMSALPELRGKLLGCWCAPQACHGDVLVFLANMKGQPCSAFPPKDFGKKPSGTKGL